MIPPGTRLVIFDADGTLRRCTVPGQPCPHSPSEWEPMPGVARALAGLDWGRTAVAVASTQDHVSYGHLTADMARRLLGDAAEAATGRRPPDAALLFCPHAMDAGCACRKPAPGLLLAAMALFGAAPDEALFVGDHAVDREAAARAGVRFLDVADLLRG